MDTARLIARMNDAAAAAARALPGSDRFALFLSASDGSARAVTVNATADSFAKAWSACAEQLAKRQPEARWLRLDWVEDLSLTTVAGLKQQVEGTKRNYFRHGIAFDADLETAFLETELNANAMLYGGNKLDHGVLNERNFTRYARQRHPGAQLDLRDDAPLWLFSTGGLFLAADDPAPIPLHGTGRNAGRRRVDRLGIADLDSLITAGSTYLARQVDADGRFAYGWHPCFDRPILTYNSLRHASTLHSMLEAYEVRPSAPLAAAIERATEYLATRLVRSSTVHEQQLAFVVEDNGEIKLGASGVCLLALVKHAELFRTDRYRALLDALGNGILHMQDRESGGFAHVLSYPALELKEKFRIIYYDGEAAFGLMRLYGLTGEARWLAAVERAFSYFLQHRHWRAHDHWLGYAASELIKYRPNAAYFRFGLRNVRSHLGFVLDRITTFPTLLELMISSAQLIAQLREAPAARHLLREIDLPTFYEALHFRAHYLLNGHFWPELAMFYRRPDRIEGSFFIRHHAFRVRIDDVEHYLSGLIGYRRFLQESGEAYPADPARLEWRPPQESGWNARNLPLATGGVWQNPPPLRWSATGVCIHRGGFTPGRIAAVRLRKGEKGLTPDDIAKEPVKPAAVLVSNPAGIEGTVPKLWVENPQTAVLDMARYARARFGGRVIGVTGSAGKTTTVAMMAHALRSYGLVGQTSSNANLPLGVAWNLASMRWDDPHIVIEMGVGRMEQSAALARPDVAVFTTIAPAHLEYHNTLEGVALRKSRMFLGMKPGALAVLNREMPEWETVAKAALRRKLRLCNYGRSAECPYRLLEYNQASGEVTADIRGKKVRYTLGAPGEHMALNSLAVIAATCEMGHDPELALFQLASFQPVAGRGARKKLLLEGKSIVAIDDSYNANPASMKAALHQLGGEQTDGRKIAVLGEMAELGEDTIQFHTELATVIRAVDIDRVYVMGKSYAAFCRDMPGHLHAGHTDSHEEMAAWLRRDIRAGDCILFKGSAVAKMGSVLKRLGAIESDSQA
ncbi:UDP-N-acetylmuramoyl-tripeptide--D-alanyl-D-alanine ligase [Aurantiacibacter xanthus]|uniref:UDP-N-acetylmuramoyl-tripeptide--D-alanyl-D-alanine ligase n=1 Tax=Aurantiacibacter xanthus TaxID=1784712 RepID=A0A3A1P4D6_9SPHN|nr:UDP-N-acetylmuramoyl-tripeptide--D-alanyl-D-alanine ligase [Aurantiacibacter xanthus]RIV84149.1 UDP-N-acetylmuramoyl-tripeptide--D-alanyl-D-alanine ligase [Aurantiacibacter xanthus]